MGRITSNDVLILISFSGETSELKNIIQYANRNKKITLIGIVSKKKSLLYKASDVKILIPDVKEAGPGGIVPTSSTIMQLSIGDALAIATMKHKKFGQLDFKKFHPSGSLGAKLKTVEDLMLTGNKIPFINENLIMKNALKIISNKNNTYYIAINQKLIVSVLYLACHNHSFCGVTVQIISYIVRSELNYMSILLFVQCVLVFCLVVC